ncbi:hypothetical protein JHK85_034505 [Glycine max]|nr:hypothetical protein JHK85_034505 [Glycine max]
MFNFPEPPTTCTHELWPETIAVHLLKNQEKWIRTLNYFNVTHEVEGDDYVNVSLIVEMTQFFSCVIASHASLVELLSLVVMDLKYDTKRECQLVELEMNH